MARTNDPRHFTVSEEDASILRRILDENKIRLGPKSSTQINEQLRATPEVYIIKAPVGGIPALSETTTGTGYPGYAECDVYRILREADYTPYLYKTSIYPAVVYNLSSGLVQGDTWNLVSKDKFGNWFIPNGVGNSTEIEVVTDICPAYLEQDIEVEILELSGGDW